MSSTERSRLTARLLITLTLLGCFLDVTLVRSQQWKPDIPRTWDDAALADWATHLHRNIGDLMRYGALVSYADAAEFGPYHVLGEGATRVRGRAPDEALYALALCIYSLKPPPNPNPLDDKAVAGQKVFTREGCPRCHTPPLYTSDKLTLA